MKKKLIALALFLILTGCTTIPLTEKDAFDIKRTISPDFFKNNHYNLQEVFFNSDSLTLKGWHISQPQARGTVLYYGGNGFTMVTSYHIITSIIEQGVNLMVFDYRGYGENPGKPSLNGLKSDGLAAYDFLLNKAGLSANQIILHGHSLGTFIATYVATQRNSNGLVLECPITDAQDWTDRLVPWLLKPFVSFEIDSVLLVNSNLQNIQKIDVPLLVLAGEEDNITPPSMAEDLHKMAKIGEKTLITIKQGGHNNLPQKEQYKESIRSFYDRQFQERYSF